MPPLALLRYVLLAGLLPQLLSAQPEWTFFSRFPAASIRDLAVDAEQEILYALLSDQSIQYSQDDGLSWQPLAQTPAFMNIAGIEAASGRLLARTSCCGIAYTDDLGQSWQWDNLSTNPVSGLGLAPTDLSVQQNHVFALSLNFQTVPAEQQLYHSAQAGTAGTWSLRHTFASGNGAIERVFHPHGQLVFVSFQNDPPHALLRSDDLGQSFAPVASFPQARVQDLVRSPDGLLYAAALSEEGQALLLRSADDGLSWQPLAWPTELHIRQLAWATQPQRLYALHTQGLSLSQNPESGQWQTLWATSGLERLALSTSQAVLLGGLARPGLWRAPALSDSFQQLVLSSSASPSWMVRSGQRIVIGPGNTPMIAYTTPAESNPQWQMHWLEDFGHTGTPGFTLSATTLPQGHALIGGIGFLARLDASSDSLVLVAEAGTAPTAPPSFTQLLPLRLAAGPDEVVLMTQSQSPLWIDHSTDGGTSWGEPLMPLPDAPLLVVLDFAKSAEGYYVLATDLSQVQAYRLFFSPAAQNWTEWPLPQQAQPQAIFLDPMGRLYLFAHHPTRLYRFEPQAQSWTALPLELPDNPNRYFALTATHSGHLYALTYRTTSIHPDDGLYFSPDDGHSWQHLPFPELDGHPIVLDQPLFIDGVLYAKTAPGVQVPPAAHGIYRLEGSMPTVTDEPHAAKESIELWPNPVPASRSFFLRGAAGSQWQLYDLWGRVRASGHVQAELQRIDIRAALPAGIYLLVLERDESRQVRRLVVGQ